MELPLNLAQQSAEAFLKTFDTSEFENFFSREIVRHKKLVFVSKNQESSLLVGAVSENDCKL